MVHPSAVISPSASIHESAEIGPFSVIGDNVTIGADCSLHSHVVIGPNTRMGSGNEVFPFASIGGKTQDLKYAGEPTSLEIGDRNVFRENCTVHRSTDQSIPTRIGDDNLFLCYSHVAHDCQVGNHVIFSNEAGVAGHCIIEDHAIVSAKAGVHQFVRIGAHSLVAGMARIVKDVPPFCIVEGTDAAVRALNSIGLQRRGFSKEDLSALKRAYKKLFLHKELNLGTALAELSDLPEAKNERVAALITFIKNSERGVTR